MRFSALALFLVVPASAFAQKKPTNPQTFTLTKQTHTGAEDVARARFAAGDCKAALDAFDVAIEHSIDPTLRRDRGLCHEKLGNAFPAIDDFRAYIAASPRAGDVEDIRARLARLEGYQPRAEGEEAPPPKTNKTLTEVERERDKKDVAEGSPLRQGSGFVVGAYLGLRTLGRSYFPFGQRAGATIRTSFDAHNTLMLEVGWHWFDADRPSGGGGITTYLGYELRIPFDPYTTHALILGAGAGYERTTINGTGAALNMLAIRARVGYRLVLGPAFGLELTADGGPHIVWAEAGGSAQVLANIGGTFAFVVGF